MMETPWEQEWQDTQSGQVGFFAEFTWKGSADEYARGRFQKWPEGLFPVGQITHKNTQGYYMVGTRTFWIIGSAENWPEVVKFCKKVAASKKVHPSPISYNYYERKDPQPLRVKP